MAIQNGSKVSLKYTLRVEGNVIDASGLEPLKYTQGASEIIPGLEDQLTGLNRGDKKQVTVTPDKGYGEHYAQAVQNVPLQAFKEAKNLKAGDIVSAQMSGQNFQATVTAITETEVTLDLNHPLAGKTLTFDIEVLGIE